MALVYVGIDEAGYGPMLGPLAVAMSAFRVEDWSVGEAAPCLWSALSPAVCASPRDAADRVPIGDSKKLKLPNDARKHPLTHLERGVLAMLGSLGQRPASDEALLHAVGAAPLRTHGAPWYEGPALSIPQAHAPASIAVDANRIATAAESARVTPLGCGARLLDERAFNASLDATGSKAEAVGTLAADLMAHAARTWGHLGHLRLVCDRQSGRSDYGGILARAFPGATVSWDVRTASASRYTVHPAAAHPSEAAASIGVLFITEAEQKHLPVALASMLAKLLRELSMQRFNRHWCARLPELKPTAGYVADARRWLADAAPVLSSEDRERLIRRA